MPDFEDNELRYEDIDWGKTTQQPDTTYVPELRFEDIDVTKVSPKALAKPPAPAQPRKRKVAKRKPVPSTFQFGPMQGPAPAPSTFRGAPLSGGRLGKFDVPPSTQAEWDALTPEEKLAFNAARERREGRVLPSVRAATPAEREQSFKAEQREQAIRTRLEGKSIFGVEVPVPDTGLEPINEIRRSIGAAHDVLSYQMPNVFLKGLAAVPEGAAEIGQLGMRKLFPKWFPVREGPASPMMRRFTTKAGEVIEEAFPTREQKNPLALIGGSAAQFIIPGGALSKIGLPAQATSAIIGATTNVQQMAQEMDRLGVDPQRRDAAIAMATVTGLSEMVGLGAMIDKFGLRQTFTRELLNIATEGGQEAVQQWLNNLNAKLVGGWDPNRPLTKDLVESTILGLGGGVLFSGINRAAIRDREKALLRSMGVQAPAPAPAVQQTLPFEAPAEAAPEIPVPAAAPAEIPAGAEMSVDLLPEDRKPPKLEEVSIAAPDITSFEVSERGERTSTPKKERAVTTKIGPPVPIDIIPVDDILSKKTDYTPEELEAAKSKSAEALEAALSGELYDAPVPPPPTAAIIGPPGNRGIVRTPDVNLVKDRLYKLSGELNNLGALAYEARISQDAQLADAVLRRGMEISSDISEFIDVIELNGEDGYTFELLPQAAPGEAPVLVVPGWVIATLMGGGEHMRLGGVALDLTEITGVVRDLYQFAPNASAEMKAYQAIDKARENAEALGVQAITFVHQWQSDSKREIIVPHETFHAAQYTLAKLANAFNNYINTLNGVPSETAMVDQGPWHLHTLEWATKNEMIQRVAKDPLWSDSLKIKDVSLIDSIAVELPAYIAGGEWYRFNMTEDEAVTFLLDYIEHLYQTHGEVALDTFERVARKRPEFEQHLKESRNKYEVWKQDQLEQWNDWIEQQRRDIKEYTRPGIEEFTGFTQERLQSSDPLEGILGPRKERTRPPTDKTAARLVGKDPDPEVREIREALFQERDWKDDSSDFSGGYWSLSEGSFYGSVWENKTDKTFTALFKGKTLGEFANELEAKDAVQKAIDRENPTREALERRGLGGLVKAIEQRFIEISNEQSWIKPPMGEDEWASTISNALWGTDLWTSDPVLNELREYVREAYPEAAAQNDHYRNQYKERQSQKGWEGKADWEIEAEEKAALEAISGPDVRFTDVEFTKDDQKQLKKLDKFLEKALREQGYATNSPGYPTLEEWLSERLYPVTYDQISKEHGEELRAWQELKNKEYQSKGGRKGQRLKALDINDLPIDPRAGLPARSEKWEGFGPEELQGVWYEPETERLKTSDNRHSVWITPSTDEEGLPWKVEINGKHVGYYPDKLWARAAGERALDQVDVSWESLQRRMPEFADQLKRDLIAADSQIMFGSQEMFKDRMTQKIRDAVYKPHIWAGNEKFAEYKQYLREAFPKAAEETRVAYEMYERRQAEGPRVPPSDITEYDYALREQEALAAIRNPREEMIQQIREELAEEKKRRALEGPRILKAVVDPATAKVGDRVRSQGLGAYGEIVKLEEDPDGMFAEVKFDDGTVEERYISDLRTVPAPKTKKPTSKVVPKTKAQAALTQTPVVSSATENLEQLILPGMEGIIQRMKEGRPANLADFDATLNKLLESKGIRPNAERRPFVQVLEGMITGQIKADELSKVLQDNDLTMEQFMNEFKATALESENASKQLMRVKMRWLKALKNNPDLQTTMVFTPSELFKSVMDDINNTRLGLSAWQRASNFIRMLMLSDINTAAVNALMTTARVPLAAWIHGFSSWMKTIGDGKAKGLSLGQRIEQANNQALDAMRAAGQVILVMNPADMIRNIRGTGTSNAERHTHIWDELVKVFPDLEMKVKAPGIGLDEHATLTNQIDIAKRLIEDMRTKGARQGSLEELKVAEDRLNSSLKGFGRVARGFEIALELVLSPMRWQEWFFRKPMFIGYLDLSLRRRGLSLEEMLQAKDLASIPESALTEAMDEALDFTYAYMPRSDGPGFEKSAYHIIKGINELKGVASLVGTMFPRAVYNGMKFTYEYSPVGAFPGIKKMLKPEHVTDPVDNEDTRTNPLTQKDYDRFAKAITGTIMFTAAMSLLKFGLMGDEWWQIKTGKRDAQGKSIYLDIRRYQPFSTFFRLADLTTRMADDLDLMESRRSLGDLQLGKELRETITGLRGFPGAEEYLSATAEMWNDQASETNVYQKASTSLGVSISFLTRPFVNLRRAVAMFDEDEMKRRDVKGTGILGPLADNIPWLRQKMLPEYVSMTEKPPVYIETSPLAAFAGFRTVAGEGFAGREWRRLGFLNRRFLAPDPNPAINRKQNEIFQKIISSAGDVAENNPAYLKLDDKGKAAYWERLVDVVAPIARKVGATADPKEALKRDFNQRLDMGPLQKKSLGLTNIFDRRPAPAQPLTEEQKQEMERLSKQAVQ